jgi:hypothetical protein
MPESRPQVKPGQHQLPMGVIQADALRRLASIHDALRLRHIRDLLNDELNLANYCTLFALSGRA